MRAVLYSYYVPVKYLTSNGNTVAVVQYPFMEGSIQSSHLTQYTHGTSHVNYSVFKSPQPSPVTHFSVAFPTQNGLKKREMYHLCLSTLLQSVPLGMSKYTRRD